MKVSVETAEMLINRLTDAEEASKEARAASERVLQRMDVDAMRKTLVLWKDHADYPCVDYSLSFFDGATSQRVTEVVSVARGLNKIMKPKPGESPLVEMPRTLEAAFGFSLDNVPWPGELCLPAGAPWRANNPSSLVQSKERVACLPAPPRMQTSTARRPR